MDGPNAQYLRPIAGLDAAMWVPPSRGQLFWLRRAPALFAPARGTGRGLARWWAIATVAPGTNVTGLNLAYQSFLNHVFHRTRLARVGHAACMPVIVTALLALLYPVHGTLPGALVLAAWWAYWAVKERDLVWGGCAVGLAAALYPLAQALGQLGAASRRAWRSRGPGCCSPRAAGRIAHPGAAATASYPLGALDTACGVPARAGRRATRQVPSCAAPASLPRRPSSAPLTKSGMTRCGARPGGPFPPARSRAATPRLTTSAPAAPRRCAPRSRVYGRARRLPASASLACRQANGGLVHGK